MKRFKSRIVFLFMVLAMVSACAAMTSLVTPTQTPKQQSTAWMNTYTATVKSPTSTVAQKAIAAQALPLIKAYNVKIDSGGTPTAAEGAKIQALIVQLK